MRTKQGAFTEELGPNGAPLQGFLAKLEPVLRSGDQTGLHTGHLHQRLGVQMGHLYQGEGTKQGIIQGASSKKSGPKRVPGLRNWDQFGAPVMGFGAT